MLYLPLYSGGHDKQTNKQKLLMNLWKEAFPSPAFLIWILLPLSVWLSTFPNEQPSVPSFLFYPVASRWLQHSAWSVECQQPSQTITGQPGLPLTCGHHGSVWPAPHLWSRLTLPRTQEVFSLSLPSSALLSIQPVHTTLSSSRGLHIVYLKLECCLFNALHIVLSIQLGLIRYSDQ